MMLLLLYGTNRLKAQELRASLITAWPGSEIYELCGHEAVRIQGDGIDSIWNFGLFNFNEPNFVYRFVKGETDYNVAGYPFEWFMPEYISRGSRVEEQVLNLTPEETARLRELLQKHSLPPLNRYRYNYIKNNCATQIADLLDSVAGGNVIYKGEQHFDTYRQAMRGYHGNYPWYQFGIDIALGSGLEEEISPREEIFIPVEFHRHAASAQLPDGRPLVKATNILYEGRDDAVLPPTPFYATPLWIAIVAAVVSALIIIWQLKTGKTAKWWYAIFFGMEGIAGCLVFFLVFISVHAATSPNILIYWLNPLQLLVPAFLWNRRTKPVVKIVMWLNIFAVGLMLILMPWAASGQASQPALIVLAATDIALSIAYLTTKVPAYTHEVKYVKDPKRSKRPASPRRYKTGRK